MLLKLNEAILSSVVVPKMKRIPPTVQNIFRIGQLEMEKEWTIFLDRCQMLSPIQHSSMKQKCSVRDFSALLQPMPLLCTRTSAALAVHTYFCCPCCAHVPLLPLLCTRTSAEQVTFPLFGCCLYGLNKLSVSIFICSIFYVAFNINVK